jgi:ribose 5-phosphate isomerase B
MKIAIGSDHAATRLKTSIRALLEERGVDVVDVGTAAEDVSVDYPDYGAAVARMVSDGQVDRGVLMCGTGIGMSIVANKFPRVRAALVHDLNTARLAREHNDANVLVMGGRIVADALAREMVAEWLDRPFEERHQRRLDKIAEIESSFRGR